MKKTWWKEGVMYQVYPRSFMDSNGDGIGDLNGMKQKVKYLKDLGVDIIWLGPVYKSPNDDMGYDISDYYDIMDEFGTMADFDELLEAVHNQEMKLIMDLVVNHSSDEHEWFKESRKSKDNPYRDYYYWKPPAEDGGPPNNWPSFFSGPAWELDETTGEYYLHLFTRKQPDLNWENPKVREEVYRIMRFWLDKGVDGFRMDVIPFISKQLDFPNAKSDNFMETIRDYYANGPRLHEFLQEMHREVTSKYDVMTVGEGPGITPELANLYVGEDRGELNMIFHLDHMFLGFGEGGRFDPTEVKLSEFKELFSTWYKALGDKGWVNIFLDNHDFARMVSRWGDDGEFRIQSAKLLAMMVMSLRGTPCIYQGSEIGMTNVVMNSIDECRDVETINAHQVAMDQGVSESEFMDAVNTAGRDNVRTPMHWDDSENAGFSTGQPWIKVNPNYTSINVKEAEEDENSILNFYKELTKFRKRHPILVYGEFTQVDGSDENLFVYKRFNKYDTFWIVLNFTSVTQSFSLPIRNNLKLKFVNYINSIGTSRILKPWEGRIYQEIN